MRVRLNTRCGCTKEMHIDAISPLQQKEITLPLRDYSAAMIIDKDGFREFPPIEARTFEFYGFEDMPLYVERRDK